jgi:hypothetical protein
MKIELETQDPTILAELFINSRPASGYSEPVAGIGTLEYVGTVTRKDSWLPDIIQLVLSYGSGVATNIIANWLYDRIKAKAQSLRVEGKVIEISVEEITKAIGERSETDE